MNTAENSCQSFGVGVSGGDRAALPAASRNSARAKRAKEAPPMAPDSNSVDVILQTIQQDAAIDFRVMLKRIYDETDRYLGQLGRAANEGRAVDEANNFLRWLRFSGITTLLEKYAFIDTRFKLLDSRCGDLQAICRPYLQGRNESVNPNLARVDELNNKVDYILSLIAKNANATQSAPLQITDVGGGQP